jgi:hypothetical protein
MPLFRHLTLRKSHISSIHKQMAIQSTPPQNHPFPTFSSSQDAMRCGAMWIFSELFSTTAAAVVVK